MPCDTASSTFNRWPKTRGNNSSSRFRLSIWTPISARPETTIVWPDLSVLIDCMQSDASTLGMYCFDFNNNNNQKPETNKLLIKNNNENKQRYANGVEGTRSNRSNVSFTTDDIQDIYMPSAIDNYKRKIAVELERRRRCAESNVTMTDFDLFEDDYSPLQFGAERQVMRTPTALKAFITPTDELRQTQIVLDDLDIFIIKKSHMSVERASSLLDENNLVKAFQPVLNDSSHLIRPHFNRNENDLIEVK